MPVLPDEDQEEFEEVRRCLLEDLRPVGEFEAVLAERVVLLCWCIRRPARAEAAILCHEQWNVEGKLASEEMARCVRYVHGDDAYVLPAGFSVVDAFQGRPVVADEDAHRAAKEKWDRAKDKLCRVSCRVCARFTGSTVIFPSLRVPNL